MKRAAFSVTQVSSYIKSLLENDVVLSDLFIEAEVSNFKAHSSGHFYFTLKDEASAINCVMFRSFAQTLSFEVNNGMRVLVYGRISLYEKTGSYQLYIEYLQPSGIGGLALAFEQLKEKLSKQGLFNAEYKKPIPRFPSCVAVITSPTGAAVRDILQIAKRRNPSVKLVLVPVMVQGKSAAAEIAQAIADVNEWGCADVIIVGRGGGSAEDLWAFNEEIVARSIFASKIPVISAVGHETDFTIADFTADLRAPTPSAAAELAVPSAQELKNRIRTLTTALNNAIDDYIDSKKDYIVMRKAILKEMSFFLEKNKLRLQKLASQLEALSPDAVIKRGYAILRDNKGKLITNKDDMAIKDEIIITLRGGDVKTVLTEV